jgi:hypothetical protein
MGFVVTRPLGTKDAELEAYVRLLRRWGKDLANVPRIPDPENPTRRWVYVWDNAEEAQQFAEELNEETRNGPWRVEATAASPSNGPFGPLLFQLVRGGDGLMFALHPLSRALIRDAFPGAAPAATNSFLDTQAWNTFWKAQGGLADLAARVAPVLTGLNSDQLRDLGYLVIDADDDRIWVDVPPARVVQGQGGPGPAAA